MAKAPDPPDYRGAAEEQGQAAVEAINAQTIANRSNQYNPWGSSTWEQAPDTIDPETGETIPGQWTQRVTLNDASQQALDQQQQTALRMSGLAGDYANMASAQPFDVNQVRGGQSLSPESLQRSLNYGSLGDMPDAQAMNQAGVDAVYRQYASRLDPQFSQREESTRAMLANQGIDPGTEAYTNEMGNFDRARNDAYASALNNAVTQGAQIGSSLFGQNMQARQQGAGEIQSAGQFRNTAAGQAFGQNQQAQQFQNTLHNQANQDQLMAAQYPIQMSQAAGYGTRVESPQFAGYSQAGQAQAPNYLGAATAQGQYDMQRYATDQAAKNSAMQGAANSAQQYGNYNYR